MPVIPFQDGLYINGVLPVAEELDTSWFDLKNYEKFKTMSILEWQHELERRVIFHGVYEYIDECKNESESADGVVVADVLLDLLLIADDLKTGHIKPLPGEESPLIDKESRSSVNNLTLYDAWDRAQDNRLIRVQPDRCKDEFDKEVVFQPFGLDGFDRATITINLFATDEQIKKDFSDWLTSSRKETDIKSQKKLASKSDFDYWIQYGVIPYLDRKFSE